MNTTCAQQMPLTHGRVSHCSNHGFKGSVVMSRSPLRDSSASEAQSNSVSEFYIINYLNFQYCVIIFSYV